MYKISGTITGHYATGLKLRAHDALTGELVGEISVDTGTASSTDYEIDVPTVSDYYVVLLPDIGDVWRPGRLYPLGAHVYPSDFETVPYYFVCSGAGISGVSEPPFVATPLALITDGHCVWERVERIPVPMVVFPVKSR